MKTEGEIILMDDIIKKHLKEDPENAVGRTLHAFINLILEREEDDVLE